MGARSRARAHCAAPPGGGIILPVTDAPLTEEEKAAIRSRLHDLEVEHNDLDDIIERLSADPAQDQLQLRRLKKRTTPSFSRRRSMSTTAASCDRARTWYSTISSSIS